MYEDEIYRQGVKEAIKQEKEIARANAVGQKELFKKAWTAQQQQ